MRKIKLTHGFTLIELMIVVAVVAILAAIAYPSYQDSVRKSRRADAKSAVLDAAQTLGRCFTQNSSYENCTALPARPYDSANGHYSITTPTLTATAFTVTATAQGVQNTKDGAYCTTFSITQTGVKNATGSNSANCWK